MVTDIHLDFESTSKAPLTGQNSVGSYKYASDPSTRILLMAVALGNGDPVVWRFNDPEHPESIEAVRLLEENPDAAVWAHNAPFEVAMNHYRMKADVGVEPIAIERMRCTQAVCRRAGVPESLENAAKFLKLREQKDKIGKLLIGIFSDQNKIITLKRGKETMKSASPILEEEVPWDWHLTLAGQQVTVRTAWEMFIEYCRNDVPVERAIGEKLEKFLFTGPSLEGFLFDLRMNHRGVPVDVPALERALELVADYESKLSAEFRARTGLNHTQGKKFLPWLQERGYPGENLKAETVKMVLDDEDSGLHSEARHALEIHALLSFAAIKKIKTMLRWVCPDGRIHGVFVYNGAGKTGRWTCKGPQFQNMKKPPKWMQPMMVAIYQAVAQWADNDDLAGLYGNPFEILACCSRYFVREQGVQVYDIDYSSVEAMVLPKLICAQRILDMFDRGESPYLKVGLRLGFDRDIGKTVTLATQFQGGWKAVFTACKGKLEKKKCIEAVRVVRDENPEFKPAWRAFQDAAVEAIQNPGKWVSATPYVKFGYSKAAPFPRLLMRLPSGRDIPYPYAKADPITMYQKKKEKVVVRENGEVEIEEGSAEWKQVAGHIEFEDRYFFHTYELAFWGATKNKNWGWVKTYGGDLLQSCIALGTPVLTVEGFKPIETITDLDLVWDGLEFVKCGGAIYKGYKEVLERDGLRATPDHEFMVDTSWVSFYKLTDEEVASQGDRLARSAIREFAGGRVDAPRAAHELEGSMRLRDGEGSERVGPEESAKDTEQDRLLEDLRIQRVEGPEIARAVRASDLPNPRLDDSEVPSPRVEELSSLRGEGDLSVQEMARPGELLQGHAAVLPGRASIGPEGQQRELHPEELPLGDRQGELQKQGGNDLHGDPVGSHESDRSRREVGDQLHDASISDRPGGSGRSDVREAKSFAPVFDILNCGPRSRFAVLTNSGLMLAHNCTQGTAADLLIHGCVEAERRGYEVFAVIHDQALTFANHGSLEDCIDALCKRPAWFHDFNLRAEGDISDSYKKN